MSTEFPTVTWNDIPTELQQRVLERGVDVQRQPNQLFQTALVQPVAALDRLEYVLVIVDYAGGLPELSPGPSGDPLLGPSTGPSTPATSAPSTAPTPAI